jgi:two-component system sensor histidine kinase KdpD
MNKAIRWRKVTLRALVVVCVLALVTYVCFRLVHVNATTAGFVYLVVVLFTAARWGLLEALIASVAAVLAFNFFFLPPISTFTIADPQNWIALTAFLATAITASQLSTAARKQALGAMAHQRDLERLYSVSRSILLLDSSEKVEQQLIKQVARVYDAPGAMLYARNSDQVYRAGPEDIHGVDDWLHESAGRGTQFRDPIRQLTVTAIRLGMNPIGSLALFGVEISDSALQGLVGLLAIGIERGEVQKRASEVEAARRSDELKSTLLDAISHEFKTPLTSIKAAVSTVLTGAVADPAQRHDLLIVIDEETDRLSGLVTDAIDMARITREKISPRRDWQVPRELLLRAIEERRNSLESRPINFEVPDDLPNLLLDPDLIRLAFRQLIDNAAKYSPPGSPIEISADRDGNQILFRVQDHGPGIPSSERGLIFERFYRSALTRDVVPGAGLGLTIAQDIVRAHGGAIRVQAPDNGGTAFVISLPLENSDSQRTRTAVAGANHKDDT